jgi:hypothetical protein
MREKAIGILRIPRFGIRHWKTREKMRYREKTRARESWMLNNGAYGQEWSILELDYLTIPDYYQIVIGQS